MNSMTGYGRATAPLGGHTLTVQVSSVNRKALDITMALPRRWDGLEPEIMKAVRGAVGRGKVHVDVELTGAEAGAGPTWSGDAVARTLERLRALAAAQKTPFEVTSDLLWRIACAESASAEIPAVEKARGVLLGALAEALRGLGAMRAQEGAALQSDLLARAAALTGQVEAIAARAPRVPVLQREQLFKRLREAGLALDLDDERVLKELALFADRCDISEELTRLRSHLAQLAQLLRADGEIGRKAEFLLQEIGREAHTIGSKANDLAVAKAVIEFKNELERVREQVANVE